MSGDDAFLNRFNGFDLKPLKRLMSLAGLMQHLAEARCEWDLKLTPLLADPSGCGSR